MSIFETEKDPAKALKFSASRAADLIAGGDGKTRLGYIFDIAADAIDCRKDISTRAMNHGINNEQFALDILKQVHGGEPNFCPIYGQKWFSINDYIGATPDHYKEEEWTADAKCQYSIYQFNLQNEKLSRKYFCQVQTQMMALKVDKAYLINYLTKPESFGDEMWTEYPFPIEDRYFIHEIDKCEETCDTILEYAEKYHPLISKCLDMIGGATILDEIEFFYSQLKGGVKYLTLKERWLNNDKEVFRYEKEFYVKK